MKLDVQPVLDHLEKNFPAYQRTLVDLSRIPSVSTALAPDPEVDRSAEAAAEAMRKAGLTKAEVLRLPGVHPYAYGEWLGAPGAPTLLLYGHHDVQPPGRPEKWHSPPFEPTLRDGRLYGRGVADDKAGVMSHVAAIDSWLKVHGRLPVNVKFIAEGEEEIGSENLGAFLRAHRDRIKADVIVLTDTMNIEAGIPSLTYALRGIASCDVEVRSLDHPLHSGVWGGPVPDPVQALSKILGSLTKEDGSLDIPGIYDDVRELTPAEKAGLAKLPFSEAAFRRDGGVAPGVRFSGETRYTLWERMWFRPALTIIAMESHPIAGCSNQIVDSARARLSLRTVPGQDSVRARDLMIKRVSSNPPWGVTVKTTPLHAVPGWMTDPAGPAFEAAKRALAAGYGRDSAMIGCGGSIGFVAPFEEVLGGAPALLLGVEDPITNAHSENESLNLDDWKKSMRAAVLLYDELSRAVAAR